MLTIQDLGQIITEATQNYSEKPILSQLDELRKFLPTVAGDPRYSSFLRETVQVALRFNFHGLLDLLLTAGVEVDLELIHETVYRRNFRGLACILTHYENKRGYDDFVSAAIRSLGPFYGLHEIRHFLVEGHFKLVSHYLAAPRFQELMEFYINAHFKNEGVRQEIAFLEQRTRAKHDSLQRAQQKIERNKSEVRKASQAIQVLRSQYSPAALTLPSDIFGLSEQDIRDLRRTSAFDEVFRLKREDALKQYISILHKHSPVYSDSSASVHRGAAAAAAQAGEEKSVWRGPSDPSLVRGLETPLFEQLSNMLEQTAPYVHLCEAEQSEYAALERVRVSLEKLELLEGELKRLDQNLDALLLMDVAEYAVHHHSAWLLKSVLSLQINFGTRLFRLSARAAEQGDVAAFDFLLTKAAQERISEEQIKHVIQDMARSPSSQCRACLEQSNWVGRLVPELTSISEYRMYSLASLLDLIKRKEVKATFDYLSRIDQRLLVEMLLQASYFKQIWEFLDFLAESHYLEYLHVHHPEYHEAPGQERDTNQPSSTAFIILVLAYLRNPPAHGNIDVIAYFRHMSEEDLEFTLESALKLFPKLSVDLLFSYMGSSQATAKNPEGRADYLETLGKELNREDLAGNNKLLILAASQGNQPLATLALSRHAQIDCEGNAPLRAAAVANRSEMMAFLVSCGATVLHSEVVLLEAVRAGAVRSVEWLLKFSPPDVQKALKKQGKAALLAAYEKGYLQVANLLIGLMRVKPNKECLRRAALAGHLDLSNATLRWQSDYYAFTKSWVQDLYDQNVLIEILKNGHENVFICLLEPLLKSWSNGVTSTSHYGNTAYNHRPADRELGHMFGQFASCEAIKSFGNSIFDQADRKFYSYIYRNHFLLGVFMGVVSAGRHDVLRQMILENPAAPRDPWRDRVQAVVPALSLDFVNSLVERGHCKVIEVLQESRLWDFFINMHRNMSDEYPDLNHLEALILKAILRGQASGFAGLMTVLHKAFPLINHEENPGLPQFKVRLLKSILRHSQNMEQSFACLSFAIAVKKGLSEDFLLAQGVSPQDLSQLNQVDALLRQDSAEAVIIDDESRFKVAIVIDLYQERHHGRLLPLEIILHILSFVKVGLLGPRKCYYSAAALRNHRNLQVAPPQLQVEYYKISNRFALWTHLIVLAEGYKGFRSAVVEDRSLRGFAAENAFFLESKDPLALLTNMLLRLCYYLQHGRSFSLNLKALQKGIKAIKSAILMREFEAGNLLEEPEAAAASNNGRSRSDTESFDSRYEATGEAIDQSGAALGVGRKKPQGIDEEDTAERIQTAGDLAGVATSEHYSSSSRLVDAAEEDTAEEDADWVTVDIESDSASLRNDDADSWLEITRAPTVTPLMSCLYEIERQVGILSKATRSKALEANPATLELRF